MSLAKANKWAKREKQVLALSFLFPLVHFIFPYLHRSLELLRYSDDFYMLYGYCKLSLIVLQLIWCVVGLVTGTRIYINRMQFRNGRIAVTACFLRLFPVVYLVLMIIFLRLFMNMSFQLS
jgi:hypothetical protein